MADFRGTVLSGSLKCCRQRVTGTGILLKPGPGGGSRQLLHSRLAPGSNGRLHLSMPLLHMPARAPSQHGGTRCPDFLLRAWLSPEPAFQEAKAETCPQALKVIQQCFRHILSATPAGPRFKVRGAAAGHTYWRCG